MGTWLPWAEDRCLPKLLCPSPAELNRWERIEWKDCGRDRKRERDHSPAMVMSKTDSTGGDQIWLRSWKENPNLRIPFLHPSFLPGISFAANSLCVLPLQQWRGQWMGSMASWSRIVSAVPFSSGPGYSNSSLAWGSSSRKQSFPNFPNFPQAAVLRELL